MKPIKWIGPGSLPMRSDIEYRLATWDEDEWSAGRVMYVGNNVCVIGSIDTDAEHVITGPNTEVTVRPVGGVYVSEYEEFLRGVVGVVEATRYEKHSLWKEYAFSKKVTWEAGLGGPMVTIGKVDGRPVVITLMVDVIDGHRVLFVDATSQVVDWTMIDEWLLQNMPSSAYRKGSQYLNRQDPMNFYNVLPRP